MSQQLPWGSSRQQQSTRLAPISTAFAQDQASTPSPSGPRAGFSPATSNFPSLPPASTRHVPSRKSSAASSTSSLFSPSHAGQQLPPSQLLSSRSRTIAPQPSSHLASSAAALPVALLGAGASASSGGGAPKLARASPSQSASSTVGSPSTSTNPATTASTQNLSRIVIAQVFLLLSQFGPAKDEKDRLKQTEQIRKLIDSNGMEVFSKYFRRLIQNNAGQVFSAGAKSPDSNGSYQILWTEMQKIQKDPEQAIKIAESLDSTEGDLFRDFDLSTFIFHFNLDVFAQMALALACRSASKADLKTKAESVVSKIADELLMKYAHPPVQTDGLSLDLQLFIFTHLLEDPPRDWPEEKKAHVSLAIYTRYRNQQLHLPAELDAVLQLPELTDPSQNPLVKLIQRAGPRATSSVESCKEILASAETRDISYQQVADVLLYMAITQGVHGYNPKSFVSALREHRTGQRLDWQDVVHAFDRERLRLGKAQFLAIYNALLPIATEVEAFDIQLLWGGSWQHEGTQLAILMCFLSCTPDELDVSQIPRLRVAFTMQIFAEASDAIKEVAERAAKHPYVSLDATTALFNMIFRSSESYSYAQGLGIPDAIINPHTAEFLLAAVAVPKPWGALQEQALKQLFDPYFMKKLSDYDVVLHGLWQQDPKWLVDRFVDSYNADSTSLTLILEHAEAHDWLDALIRSNTDISLDLAAQAHARGLFDIEPWLQQTFDQAGLLFRRILTNFLSARASDEMQTSRDDHRPTSLPVSVKTVYSLLWFLAETGISEDEFGQLQRNCIHAYPRLINYGEGVDEIIDANGRTGNRLPVEADTKMQEHFKNMYSGDSDVRDIINILKKYKESQEPADQDLFACMIHGLFDEYNCFGEYPLEALATTAVLFGGIINYSLLSRIALQVGLAMVLEAVTEYRPEDSMYKFGLQALLHFSSRLHEWPRYADQLLTVPGLQGTEIYSKAEEVVGQREREIDGEPRNGMGMTNGTNGDDLLQAEPAVPKFSCLHVDSPLRPDYYEDPDEDVQDKVLFVLNNVSERNLRDKINDLTEAVEERHHQWFAGYLVEERAKMQPNFQQLYLDMLELFNDRMLWAEVLRETFVAVFRLLNSEGQLGSTERTHLKNLGGWLGSLTIARDQPIKFRNISFKDLLIEGFETERLVIVIPFTCKVLVQAARSTVFKPPNPWLMEIIKVLLELYYEADLKLNQKFEIEVLCKGLDLDHKAIDPSTSIRTRPQIEEEYLGPIPADGMEAFSDLSLMSLNRTRGPSERFSSAAITAALPDFSNQLIYPPSGNSVVPATTIKKIFLTAVQQAIQEIIAPVVERSVTIAAISTSQLVNKDFAMEPDEDKLRNAAHTVVKSLSGALALVTCKEPLRMSIMNNIRVMARDLPEQAVPEGHVLMFVSDNLDLVCGTVEQAAELSSMNEIDMQIEDALRMRRLFRQSRTSEPFKDANISPWAFYIPDPYKQTAGGLNRDQLAIYEEFGRQSRSLPHANNVSQDSGRQMPDVLQDQFAAVPNLPTPAAAPAEPRQQPPQQRLQGLQGAQPPSTQQQLNGYMEPSTVDRDERNVEDLMVELTRSCQDTAEERLSELSPTSPIHGAFDRLIYSIEHAGVNKDSWAFRVAGQVTNHLFSKQLRRLETEVLTQLLTQLCQMSVQTSRQVLMWLGTLHDDSRIFNATAMVCLMEVGLMDMHRLNTLIAKAITERRQAAVEMLSNLMDEILLNEQPSALRADFALSIDALTNWLAEDPDLEIGKQLISKLQVLPTERALTPPSSGNKDQLEYVFDEWVHLQLPDTPKKSTAVFIYQLHQSKVMETQEDSIEFIRTCVDVAVTAFEQEEFAPFGTGNPDTATIKVDALGKLVVSLVVYQGDFDGAVQESKAKYLDTILLVLVLVLCNHQKTRADRFNQKVFFRLMSAILFELNEAVKENVFAGSKTEVFLALARAFLILQPRNFPLFTFSWLTLVSHRIFMPAMLEDNPQEPDGKNDRWNTYATLMETLLNYTGQLIKPTGETVMAQKFYQGVLRVLLVIHHDYPEFLAENHFSFCNSIPMHCTQLRNLIVSAYPSHIIDMPDPFSAGLKADRIEDIRQSPLMRVDLDQILEDAGIQETIDSLLSSPDLDEDDVKKVCNATYFAEAKPPGFELMATTSNPNLIHAIVLYLGEAALESQGAKNPNFDPSAPAAKLLDSLAKELRPEARFHFISAIANQLRWPNAHTHYFSHALLHLFGPPNNAEDILEVQQTITRVLLERLLVHRPHPWGLIITLLEILKNRTYAFWDLPFVKAAPEVERLFNALFNHVQQSPRPLV